MRKIMAFLAAMAFLAVLGCGSSGKVELPKDTTPPPPKDRKMFKTDTDTPDARKLPPKPGRSLKR
jgi:predicted small lipoprotein YifL